MSVERRGHPRYDIMAQIRVKRGRVNYIMDVKNVSLSGMLVESEAIKQMPWFRIGQELEMDIFTTEELVNVRVNGRIARIVEADGSKPAGFGVEFSELGDQEKERIALLVDLAEKQSIHPPPLPEQDQGQNA